MKLRKDLLLVPFIGIHGYVAYRAVEKIVDITTKNSKYEKICEEIIIDMNLDMKKIISGEHELTEDELNKIARVYKLRTNRDIYEDITK